VFGGTKAKARGAFRRVRKINLGKGLGKNNKGGVCSLTRVEQAPEEEARRKKTNKEREGRNPSSPDLRNTINTNIL